MKRSAWEVFVFFGFLAAAAFVANLITFSPCDTPKTFRIAQVDSRFGLSPDDFLKDIEQATAIWNTAEEKKLFQYDGQNGVIGVSLVFDNRQKLSNEISSLQNRLDAQKGTIDEQIVQYRKDKAAFEQKVADLNTQIAYWNSKGGAPPEEYNKLTAQQKALKDEAQTLNARAKSLNQSTDSYNVSVGQLDQTVTAFNQTLSYKPEEGLYDGKEKTVTIYFDNNQNELVHTLAHEFGHALGLDHNGNSKSIMFAYSTTSLTPTQDDFDSLTAACRKRSYWEIARERLALVYQLLQKRYLNQPQ